jgi:hypothetical protein
MSKYERTIYFIVIFLLLILAVKSCSTIADLNADYNSVNKSYNEIRVKHNEDSSKIYSMQVEFATKLQEAERKSMALSLMKLKDPKEIVKIVYRTMLSTEIPLDKPTLIDTTLYIKLPQHFKKLDKWFIIDGQITTKGVIKIDSLNSFGTFTYAVGDTMRTGFFNRLTRKKDHVVRLHIDNPYMQVTNLENIYVREEKKWYRTTGFKMLVGAAIGFGVATSVK